MPDQVRSSSYTLPSDPPPPYTWTKGSTIFLATTDGASYAVYDCLEISGHMVTLGYHTAAAEYRLFVPLDGPKRLYTFKADEERSLHPKDLDRQAMEAVVQDAWREGNSEVVQA